MASDHDFIGLALACVNDVEKALVILAVAEYIFCVSCTGLVNSCVIGSVPLCSIFSMKRVPSHTAEMIEGDVTNNMSRNSVVSNSVAIEPALVVTASMTPSLEANDVYVPVDRPVLHAVEHRPEPTREAVETNAIDPHRDFPVRRAVSPGEQTIPQERVQVRVDELNVELLTPQFVEENVDVMVDIPVLPQTMRCSVEVW